MRLRALESINHQLSTINAPASAAENQEPRTKNHERFPMFTFTPMPHDEAVKRIASLPIVSREVMQGLLPELRAHAFTVSGLTKASQLSRVKKLLESVPAGANWDDAKKQVVGELATAGITGKEAQRRAETLLRTTAFRAYAATRYQVLMRQTDVFPFWQYKTAGDGRVRPAHTALHNRIFPAGHPVWQRIFPPWGWGCRCLVVPLTKRTAEQMGVQGEELRAKGEESLPADGGLLKGQRQAPILYTPQEADLIEQSARLPGGISIEVEPSWGRAPWSEKGNLRPSWAYLEELYKDDAEAFAAFREWAEKTEISKGRTVGMWIDGARKFKQPMHRTSGGLLIDLTDAEDAEIRRSMADRSELRLGAAMKPLKDDMAGHEQVAAFEAEVAKDSHENGATWGLDGNERERVRSEFTEHVTLKTRFMHGAVTSHSHPNGGPPSLVDLNNLFDAMPVEMRIITADHLHRVRPGKAARPQLRLRDIPELQPLLQASGAVAESLGGSDSRKGSNIAAVVLDWLARNDYIEYERIPR
jgi:SPP1 gp7 family putative phage head morphogenesis protein